MPTVFFPTLRALRWTSVGEGAAGGAYKVRSKLDKFNIGPGSETPFPRLVNRITDGQTPLETLPSRYFVGGR